MATINTPFNSFSHKEVHEMNKGTLNRAKPVDPGAPAGDPKKFIERQTVLLRSNEVLNRSMCFQILDRIANQAQERSVIDKRAIEHLNVLSGNDSCPSKYLSGVLCENVQTEIGRSYFLSLLANPSNNLNTLKARQEVIRSFLDHDTYHSLFSNLAKMQGTPEAELLGFWGKWQLPGYLSSIYSKNLGSWNDPFNQNSIFLSGQFVYITGQRIAGIAITCMAIVAATFSVLHVMGVLKNTEYSRFAAHFANNLPARIASYIDPNSSISQLAVAATTIYMASTIKGTYEWLLADLSVGLVVRDKLKFVAQHFRAMKAIYNCVQGRPELKNGLQNFSKLEEFLSCPKLQPLIHALESGSLNIDAGISNPGTVLVVCELLQQKDVKETYEKALTAIAEIDAFMGAAKLVSEQGYCFVEHTDENSSSILEIENFFHPQLDVSTRVTNSLAFENGANRVIITGQNGRGKSTTAKGFVSSLLLAHVCGIAPASKMKMSSSFSLMRTSMPSRDNLGEGKSGFTNECAGLDAILHDIANLSPTERGIVIIDEPYKSTDGASTIELSGKLFDRLSQYRNIIQIVLTNEDAVAQKAIETRFSPYRITDHRTLEQGVYQSRLGGLVVAEKIGHI